MFTNALQAVPRNKAVECSHAASIGYCGGAIIGGKNIDILRPDVIPTGRDDMHITTHDNAGDVPA